MRSPCSLTCRVWAIHIRPLIFSEVVLRSQEKTRTFSELIRSPVVVPVPLREAVRKIKLVVDDESHPWMYHVWVLLLRDAILPNLQSITVAISGKSTDPPMGRSKCETLLDIGFPRTLPCVNPLRLNMLHLDSLKFRSCEFFLVAFTAFSINR